MLICVSRASFAYLNTSAVHEWALRESAAKAAHLVLESTIRHLARLTHGLVRISVFKCPMQTLT